MPRLTIDNRNVDVPAGATVLDAAGALGIDIPALCFLKTCRAETSCMVCVVRVAGRDGLVPSCATVAEDGMVVTSESDEIRSVRKAAVELLMSDHLGDCIAPCQMACPLGMDVPALIRSVAAGRFEDSADIVRRRVALPGAVGRICHRPCERACRRREVDSPVAICLIERFVAERCGAAERLPDKCAESGKNVAVVGAGPAGLSAAYHLLLKGHGCTIFEAEQAPGGSLQELAGDVLKADIAAIEQLGAEIRLGQRVGDTVSIDELKSNYNAVVLAWGECESEVVEALGLKHTDGFVEIKRGTFETSVGGVFAVGGVVNASREVVRVMADGASAASATDQYLRDLEVVGSQRRFSCHIGKLGEDEIASFLAGASDAAQVQPRDADGFDQSEARNEARRCLHCDCRAAGGCKLQDACEFLDASARRYKSPRRQFVQLTRHDLVIYEPGKCIACGLCIQAAEQAHEELGLTFIGRGFDIRPAVPFGRSLSEGLKQSAEMCARVCPTGALSLKEQAGRDD